MPCPRCKTGCMGCERAGDVFDRFLQWFCYNCGERIDAQILANRKQPCAPQQEHGRWSKA